ncbi:hypothetical protein KAF25_008348 [Fusarium avenaceum]|uniref:Uncharacterized protein n=1 Tax=Fusarium avenaceum TaxID=40199 RepID=A0A9P7H9K4_9HYPO|nr:hypothetical protein KAF25_008348 [Fusarium avenaceum]
MDVSPGSKSPGSSRREGSLTLFDHIEDERDFDKLGSVIPDSQVATKTFTAQPPRKRFSVPEEEVSISTISEGFCFGEKKPPRPGQFSERPRAEKSQATETSCFFPKPSDLLPQRPPSNQRHAPVLQTAQPAAPLDLPEIGLVGRGSYPESSPAPRRDSIVGSSSHTPRSLPGKASSTGIVDGATVTHVDSPAVSRTRSPSVTAMSKSPAKVELFSSAPECRRMVDQDNDPGQTGERSELPSFQPNDRQRSQHHPSSSSACGDLEAPFPQIPKATTARDYSSRSHRSSQPPPTSEHYRYWDSHRGRSQSRASNISKKRSTRRKVRSQPTNDPNRKKVAMQNVAQHWNECIQIAEAERHEAIQEIVRLEDKVNHTKEVLRKSMQVLSEKDSRIQESESRCHKLEKAGSLAEKERQKLHIELESLRSDLAKSRDHATSMQEKYRKNKAKLNEAIEEQQALFSRARVLHQETNEELQTEKDRRAADAKAVEVALEASQKKREELRDCIEEYRAEAEQEMKQKNRTISELQTQLELQQKELAREKDMAVELQSRLESESALLDKITTIHSDIRSLKDSNDKQNEWSEKCDKTTAILSEKLDLMGNQLKVSTESQLTNGNFKSMMQDLQANILSRLTSELHNVISSQVKAEQSATSLQDTISDHFGKLHSSIMDQQKFQSKDQQWREETRQALGEHLDYISTKTIETQKTCNETKSILDELATGRSAWQEGFQSRYSTQVIEQLADRESKIGKLEETLRQVSQDWSRKLDTMRSTMHDSDEQAKKHLQTAVQEIRIQLEEKLQEEEIASEQDISRSEAMQATLKTHLEQVKLQLEGVSSNDSESQLLRETLAEERRKTCALQEQLAKSESDSKANGELCQRQHQDLRAIETLKSQLQDMSEQVPRVETLNTTFNKMVDLNQMMQSTALYLSKERHWVNEQLSTTSQDVDIDNPQTNTSGTESVYFGGKRSEEPAARVCTQSTDTKLTASLSDLSTLDVHSQGERYRRKVTVASPALGVSSTTQPPSIIQEQLRRREASIPRSILRPTASSIEDPESIGAPANHSQYNRPVSAKRSSMTGFTNSAMVEQIRSGLIQSKTKRPDWEFPTMEDFAKEIHPNGRDDVKPGKKHNITIVGEVEDNAPAMKRVKSEEPQDDSADVDAMDRHRPLMLRTHHVIRKTYSKKQSD